MKFTLSWLKDHLDTAESLDQLTDRLTQLGLEVESVVNPATALNGFKVAHIIDAQPHPQADRLQVCTVDCGQSTPLQVVCGAPNARRGLKVVLGLPGTYVPGIDVTLKEAKIRGVESFGMLCSANELGLGDGHEGILELEAEAPVGMNFAAYAGLDDPVIEVSITPNRPDCLGVRGIARDLAAVGAGRLKPLETAKLPVVFKTDLKLTLDKAAEKACPHYMGRVIRGVKNKPSPDWLQKRLKAIGLKPISALVDITNYVSFDLCRPLHAFDLQSIKDKVFVRFAQSGESFLALDEKKYILGPEMLVIADTEKVLALGGVMGGLESGCTLDTESILLESAYFDPLTVARAGRKLNLHSDSRARFERGIDPLSTWVGIERATQLILEICGGEASEVVELGEPLVPQCPISFHVDQVAKRTGVTVDEKQAHKILESLGFSFPKAGIVVPPSWRPDITISEDVVEEVIRIYGYDHLPEIDLPSRPSSSLGENQSLLPRLRHLLASRSFMEVVTWSMVSEKQFRLFGGTDENLRIVNPITVDLEYLRPSVLIHLLKAVQQNLDRGIAPLSFFEIGPRYQEAAMPQVSVSQFSNIAAVRVGKEKAYHWSKQERSLDVFDIKADLFCVLEACGISPESVQVSLENLPSWYHPGRAGWIQRGPKNILGIFGEIHPGILKEFGIKERVVGFELNLSGLGLGKKKGNTPLILSPFQKVERDFCFLFDQSVKAGKIIATLKKLDPCVQDVQIFDLYEGTGVPEGLKSVSIHMTFEPMDHTFSDTEIKTLYDRVVQTIQTQLQGSLRL